MFKIMFSVQITTKKYTVLGVYFYTNIYYLELRNHVNLLAYLVIYKQFPGLH